MNKFFVLVVFIVSNIINAQVTNDKNKDFYEGGAIQFYKDFHEIWVSNGFASCDNKNEIFIVKVLIKEDSTIEYLLDEYNSKLYENNKCAYNLGKDVTSQMKKWKPLLENGIKTKRFASIYIFPDALGKEYKEGYILDYTPPKFGNSSNTIENLYREIRRFTNLGGLTLQRYLTATTTFTVNSEGKIENVKLAEPSGNVEFDKRILKGIKSIRKKWIPAKIHNIAVPQNFRLPFTYTDLDDL